MSAATNSLVTKIKRFAFPAGLVVTGLLTVPFLMGHCIAHAAGAANQAAPLSDSSVAPLVALDNAVETVAAHVTPAVVNVAVTAKVPAHQMEGNGQDGGNGQGNMPPGFPWFFFGQGGPNQQQAPQVEHGIGSGVIISPDGYIVTNNHVVQNATQIQVTLNDRRTFPAKLIGTDKLNDLAVIKINATGLTSIPWGDSTKLHQGQTVLAFGSPFGYFKFSVTRGIVSALDRPNPYTDDTRKPGDFIQTDAAINPGNSGGPLVDAHGEVIGINTFIISNSGSFAGAGFAIPSEIAKHSVDELIKNGKVSHGYLGIGMNDVTPENASFFNLPDATGAIISQVTPDSPASRGGLKSGDVLREINGRKIENSSFLQVVVSQMSPGTQISLGILRDGKPMTIKVTVGEFHGTGAVADNGEAGGTQQGKLGLTVENLTPALREQLDVPSEIHGVAIDSVRSGSAADNAGLAPGEVIMQVNRHPVANLDELSTQIHASPESKGVLLLVWSKQGTFFRVVQPDQGDQGGQGDSNN